MAISISPSVQVTETDLTTVIPNLTSGNGGTAGVYEWGPVMEVTTVASEIELVRVFGEPKSNTATYFYTAANFLQYANNLKVVRTVNSAALNSTSEANVVSYSASTGTFTMDEVVTGGTSGATAILVADNGTSILTLALISGTFTTTEVITGADSGATATLSSAITAGSGLLIKNESDWSTKTPTEEFYAKYPGSLGDSIKVSIVGATGFASWAYSSAFDHGAPGVNEYHIAIIDVDGAWTGTKNTVLEKYSFVSTIDGTNYEDGSIAYYKDLLDQSSKYVWVGVDATLTSGAVDYYLSNSAHDATAISDADLQSGFLMFVDSETVDVSQIIAGPVNGTVAGYVIDSVADIRKDVITFISPELADVVNNVGSEVTAITAFRDTLSSTSYAVMDSGWKYQLDRYNNKYRWIPLCGDTAGLQAQAEPWESPAGFNKGNVKNVSKLAWQPNKTDRDELYKKGVNPIVSFPGQGTILYGDKTLLSRPSAFDRINVRALFNYIEKSISLAAKFSLFELNDEFTRSQFVNMVEPYLREVQGNNAIQDFKVISDTSNNTGQVIDSNQFVADIYIKPARSINFIRLNFVAVRSDVTFSEIIG